METLRLSVGNRPLTIGIVLFDKYVLLDVYIPLELLAEVNSTISKNTLNVVTVTSESSKRVKPFHGPVTLTDYCMCTDNLPLTDLLLVPGRSGIHAMEENAAYMSYLEQLVGANALVYGVSTGVLLQQAISTHSTTLNNHFYRCNINPLHSGNATKMIANGSMMLNGYDVFASR